MIVVLCLLFVGGVVCRNVWSLFVVCCCWLFMSRCLRLLRVVCCAGCCVMFAGCCLLLLVLLCGVVWRCVLCCVVLFVLEVAWCMLFDVCGVDVVCWLMCVGVLCIVDCCMVVGRGSLLYVGC